MPCVTSAAEFRRNSGAALSPHHHAIFLVLSSTIIAFGYEKGLEYYPRPRPKELPLARWLVQRQWHVRLDLYPEDLAPAIL